MKSVLHLKCFSNDGRMVGKNSIKNLSTVCVVMFIGTASTYSKISYSRR